MRILDRYAVVQLLPVWLWCLALSVFLSCLIDLFEHLDEILRYHIPVETVLRYYLNFIPFVIVRASPIALLLSCAFVAMRLSRHQELLAMHASGTSLLRAGVPFLFVGWLASLLVFIVNDRVVPATSVTYERIKREAFRERLKAEVLENATVIDAFNRLYHARELDLDAKELSDLTILEQDLRNRPTKSWYASRAVWTKHGWLLLYGTIYRIGEGGAVEGEPQRFVEQLVTFPVTVESFTQPEARPDTMPYGQLRLLITRLTHLGMTNLQRYQVELASKLTLPLMNLVMCLLAFAGSTQVQLRGHLRGLGISLVWGLCYYFGVGFGEGVAKKGIVFLPVLVSVWAPHLLAVWWGLRVLRRTQ